MKTVENFGLKRRRSMARKKVDPEKRTEQLKKLKEKKLEFHVHADKDGKNLFPGVFFLLSKKHSLGKEEEPVYYIRYRSGEGAKLRHGRMRRNSSGRYVRRRNSRKTSARCTG
jgi:hypothetical protein